VLLVVVAGFLAVIVAIALLRPSLTFGPGATSDVDAHWWLLDFPMAGHSYRLLFHRQEGRLYRLKIEYVDGGRPFQVCEYFQEPGHEAAQRYDPRTGVYIEEVASREDFRILAADIVQLAPTANGGLGALWPGDRQKIVALATRVLRACLGPSSTR